MKRIFWINAKAAQAVAMAAVKPDQPYRPAIKSVHIDAQEMAATDSFRIHRFIFSNPINNVLPDDGICLPAEILKSIKPYSKDSNGVAKLELTDDDLCIINDNQMIKLENDQFPKYRHFFDDLEQGDISMFGINAGFMQDAMSAVRKINRRAIVRVFMHGRAENGFPQPIIVQYDFGFGKFQALIMPVKFN